MTTLARRKTITSYANGSTEWVSVEALETGFSVTRGWETFRMGERDYAFERELFASRAEAFAAAGLGDPDVIGVVQSRVAA